MNLDGTEPQVLAKDSLNQIVKIACDVDNKVIYWTEGYLQKVSNLLSFTQSLRPGHMS